ncbi:MAG TPA: hypothetical protein VFA89_19205 [Terriglobales bacterium]|nr:hypothetical protein [Terriglobales bacterium]
MGILDSLSDVLKNYNSGEPRNTADASEHFDQVAQAAPHDLLADGIAAAFRSDKTPAFGSLISQLFSQSNSEQKAGILNQLLASIGPGALAQLPGGATLAGLLGSAGNQITPDQAQKISSETVQQVAAHAEKTDPSIVERAGAFYAQHSTLVKTLGGAALSIALAKVAERQRAA